MATLIKSIFAVSAVALAAEYSVVHNAQHPSTNDKQLAAAHARAVKAHDKVALSQAENHRKHYDYRKAAQDLALVQDQTSPLYIAENALIGKYYDEKCLKAAEAARQEGNSGKQFYYLSLVNDPLPPEYTEIDSDGFDATGESLVYRGKTKPQPAPKAISVLEL